MTNASQPTTSVVVVGAGPTGLSLSCALQAAGIAVRIVDAAAAPATTSRALAVQPRGVEVLERLGVVAHLATAAVPVRRVEIFVDGHKLAGLRVPQALRPEDPGCAVGVAGRGRTPPSSASRRLGGIGGVEPHCH